MDLLSPLRLGVHVATDAVKLATIVPRFVIHQLTSNGDDDQQRFQPTMTAERVAETPPAPTRPARTRPTTKRPPAATRPPASTARATPGRATTQRPGVERTAPPPEPTSAAGASGGIAGTAAAPGAAGEAGAPDPTAATSAAPADRTVPKGERRAIDVQPPRTTRARERTEPRRSEVDRRRVEERESVETSEATLAETEGAADPGASIQVDEPWDGYGTMKANDIVVRVKSSDEATKAVVRLYEQTHKNRKSILAATGS